MKHSSSVLIYAGCFAMLFAATWISKHNKSNRLFDAQGVLVNNSNTLLGLHIAAKYWLT